MKKKIEDVESENMKHKSVADKNVIAKLEAVQNEKEKHHALHSKTDSASPARIARTALISATGA